MLGVAAAAGAFSLPLCCPLLAAPDPPLKSIRPALPTLNGAPSLADAAGSLAERYIHIHPHHDSRAGLVERQVVFNKLRQHLHTQGAPLINKPLPLLRWQRCRAVDVDSASPLLQHG